MAAEPKLSDAEIASLMEIPHPSKGTGESIYGATTVFIGEGGTVYACRLGLSLHGAREEDLMEGAIINTTWMF